MCQNVLQKLKQIESVSKELFAGVDSINELAQGKTETENLLLIKEQYKEQRTNFSAFDMIVNLYYYLWPNTDSIQQN